ncbi:DUF1254 domain-containing protein [Pseudoduganella sp. OTU4001]|uniref:DUF1254 domain-containing protein n=1 Tax=Pseudoduganella sp. OTU4001 TaxID=3043854 RepID=UPI00313EE919
MTTLAAMVMTAAAAGTTPAAPAPEELREIAVEAYVYAYPLVLMDVTRRVTTNVAAPQAGARLGAPVNQFVHMAAFPDANFTAVVRPNADTLYSSLWFDVAKEPLVISVPDSGGRYYLLPALDMWTDVFMSPGSRTTGNHAQTVAIVGPSWQGKLPAGVTAYRAPTASGWMIGRTQTNGSADYAAVQRFQVGIKAVPLSAWGKPGYKLPPGRVDPEQDMSAPVEQVARMDAGTFFKRFAALMAQNAPHQHDAPMLDRLARAGLAPGKAFELAAQPDAVRGAFEAAPGLALKKIAAAARTAGIPANGWRVPLTPIGTYGTDYLRRAVIAQFGLGANVVEDSIYPAAFTDADGKPFDSSARYVIHFDQEQLPPVRAFWSLAMYNERQFFAANPIGRYSIGDRDTLSYNADGSLDLYLQREAPAAELQSNWLPAPASGAFSLNLRLYWPKPAALEGQWKPPQVRRQP